jgi:hypothetical protein
MGRIGRVRLKLGDLIETQIQNALRWNGVLDAINNLNQQNSLADSITINNDVLPYNPDEDDAGSSNGYDYGENPPTQIHYDSTDERFDNFDENLGIMVKISRSEVNWLIAIQSQVEQT